tara:strand:+ start:467 stop:1384 length:918 start_codon:yes stop_codon:yes gene_type:complete
MKSVFQSVFDDTSGGGGTVSNEDWTRANIADGSWTLNDPDNTISSVSNTGGVNQLIVNTTHNPIPIAAGVHYKEILNADGTSIDFGDRPVSIQIYIHWPNTGWDAGGSSGGNNRPAAASRCYTVAGVMTDPEHLPSSAGAAEWPTDVFGYGLRWRGNVTKTDRMGVQNLSTSAPKGAITVTTANNNVPTTAEYAAGKKCINRILWFGRIEKLNEGSSTGINTAGQPLMNEFSTCWYWDTGWKKVGDVETPLNQRFGRVRTNKLYLWVSNGRGDSGAGSNATIDFNLYYKIEALAGGNHPSGTTPL